MTNARRLHRSWAATWPRLLLCSALTLGSACRRENPPPAGGAGTTAASETEGAKGTIDGVLGLGGRAPPATAISLPVGLRQACGQRLTDASLRVGPSGGLQDVVVFAEGGDLLPKTAMAPARVRIDQRACAYWPPVAVSSVKSTLEVRNSDPLLHNVRASGETPLFNVAMPLSNSAVSRLLPERPAVIQLRCDVHPWMRAVIRTFSHPYFALSDEQGRFRLGLPPGRHRLVLWHQRLPPKMVEVQVRARETSRLEVSWQAAEVRAQL